MDFENIAQNYKQAGIDAYKKGNYKEAIKCFTSAIDNREDATFYSNRAACYQMLKKYDLCIKDCLKIIEFDSQFVKAYTRKGQSELCLGKIDQAIETFLTGLAINSGDEGLKKNMNNAKNIQSYNEDMIKNIAEDDLKNAIMKCELILEECIVSAEFHLKKIELLNKNGEVSKAKQKIESLLAGSVTQDLRYNPI